MPTENPIRHPERSKVVIVHGARATEDAVIGRVLELLADRGPDLTAPIRVVVASGSQRDHLAAELVRRLGRPAVGVRIQTHYHLALEALENAVHPHPGGLLLFDILVRRFARQQRPLREALDDLADGYATVTGTVRDFFDAGFEVVHFEPLDEFLRLEARTHGRSAELRRARALLKTALTTSLAYEEFALSHRSTRLRRAREVIENDPRVLPCRAILVHGFADATGVVSDLLEALLRAFPTTLYLDQPPDPAHPGGRRYESAYTARLLARLQRFAAEKATVERPPAQPAPELALLDAADPDSEVRELAVRLKRLIESGEEPQRIAVVARRLEGYGLLLRRHFRRLGVPFSARGRTGPLLPLHRDHQLLLDLLQHGADLRLERWLSGWKEPAVDPLDLRLAFFAQGLTRLRDVAQVEASLGEDRDGQYRLPLRQGLEERQGRAYALHRRLDSAVVERALAAAHRLTLELAEWADGDASRPFRDHCARLERVVDEHLGWPADHDARVTLGEQLEQLRRDLPPDWPLTRDELTLLLRRALDGCARAPLGGDGGGVQVLSAIEARSLTFRHLFLIGVHRELFPRPVHEDPLLSDRLRSAIARLLPDLPIKSTGFDEERHLFAQLLSCAPRVTLSWPRQDGAGRALAPSPLLERWRDHAPEAESAGRPWTLAAASDGQTPRTVVERLILRGLHGGRDDWAAALPPALGAASTQIDTALGAASEQIDTALGAASDETAPGVPAPVPAALARGRRAVIEELDPDLTQRDGRARARRLGPYFGFIGGIGPNADPRRQDLYVTTLENLAACPWQTFLRRLLRLQPTPDPLASLPALRGLLVGQLVHRVLEAIALEQLARDPLRERGVEVRWPDDERLDALLEAQAGELLAESGLHLRGLARAAARLARPYLEQARQQDWRRREPRVLGVETDARCLVRHGEALRPVRFKADRVDLAGGGVLRTDYKTGGTRQPRSRQRMLDNVTSGDWLQLAAYVYGAPELDEADRRAAGRYLFLRPDLDDDERSVEARAEDRELRRRFESTVVRLLDLWDAGCFFPRLIRPDEDLEPRRCSRCEVAEACLRRDSGSRVRLRRWSESPAASDQVARAVWDLRGGKSTLSDWR